MYAITNDPQIISRESPAEVRKRLGAIYARRLRALREVALRRVGNETAAEDVVQDAFVRVLENPPTDTSERALVSALDDALRVACGRHAKQGLDDERLCISLRKRFPV